MRVLLRPSRLVLALWLAVLCGRARAEPASAPPEVAAARAAFASWQALEAEQQREQKAFAARVQAAASEAEKKALREGWSRGMRPFGQRAERASEAFRAAFERCDAAAFDPAADAALLEQGLMLVGEETVAHDPKGAVAAFERVLTLLPDCPSALHARCTWLPLALPSTGDLEGAMLRCVALMAQAPEAQWPSMQAQIGDIWALRGDYAAAQRQWADALASIPAVLDKGDPRGWAKEGIQARVDLVGKPAPALDAKTWLGGDARPLAALRGRVVVLDFWATWCGPCLHGIPGMAALHRDRAAQGVVVLGVTMPYRNGFLPSGPDQLRWNFKDGDTVSLVGADGTVDEKANLDLLARFRERIPMPYPTAVAAAADFSAWKVGGIPTVAVIGKDGRVGFVASGSRREALVRLAVDRLVLEPAPSDAPAAGR